MWTVWLAWAPGCSGGGMIVDFSPPPPLTDRSQILIVSGSTRGSFGPDDAFAVIRDDLAGETLLVLGDLDGDGATELGVDTLQQGGGVAIVTPADASGTVDLGDLARGWVTFGEDGDAASLTDRDGDGAPELVVSGASADGGASIAPSYIAILPSSSLPLDQRTVAGSDAATQIAGANRGMHGAVDVGDLDGDGLSELCAVANYPDGTTGGDETVYSQLSVWFGATLAAAEGAGALSAAAPDAWIAESAATRAVCPDGPIGDLDGDGLDDLLIYDRVLSGALFGGGGAISADEPFAWPIVLSVAPEAHLLGDLNGDGAAELWRATNVAFQPAFEVFDGASLGPSYGSPLVAADRIDGVDRAGLVPDLDGDGAPEIWVARRVGPVATQVYVVELYSGGPALDGTWPVAPLSQMVAGAAAPSLAAVGDLDGDGVTELAVGAPMPFAEVGGVNARRGSSRRTR